MFGGEDPLETFDLYDPASVQYMLGWMAELRRRRPVARLASGEVFVAKYRDVRSVLRNAANFSSAGGFKADGVFIPLGDASLGDFDEPEHAPFRKLAMAAAGPSRLEGERPFAVVAARELVDGLAKVGGTSDVVSALALPLSSQVTAHLLGAPVTEANRLFGWAEDIMHSEFPIYLRTDRGGGYHGAFPEYAAFVDRLIDDRLDPADGRDDAIKRVIDGIAGGEGTPTIEAFRSAVFMIVSTLLLGGVTTTRDFIGWLLYELVRRPELYQTVQDDRTLVATAVEEALRLCPPVLYLMRKCLLPTDIGGVPIETGDRVLVGLASANRDQEHYSDADEFKLDRRDTPPSLTFGHGIHMCVGNALARMEGEVILNAVLDRFDASQVSVAPTFELELMPVPFMYGPRRVDLAFAKD
jgi:cytochrome P450 family 142 subfamily A polypeptide 1